MQDERRLYQRLHLTRPLKGRFGTFEVRLMDVSAGGALLETDDVLAIGSEEVLSFRWHDQEVTIRAAVQRNAANEWGVEFREESELLRRLIAESAEELLRAQQANMEGNREANVVGDETLTAASAGLQSSGYIVWTLSDGTWKKRRALLPDQPEDGFTVAASEPYDQVELLRQTWENGNDEARTMTRLLAELSAASVRMK